MPPPFSRALVLLCCASLLPACSALGPTRLRSDNVEYADAISASAKEQMLLNIVKLRYGDYPSFVAVGQVVSGYSRSVSGTVGTGIVNNFNLGNDLAVGTTGGYTENPSVTYRPLTGNALSDVLFAPVRPSDLFGFLASGTPDEVVLGLGLKSLGDYRNAVVTASGLEPAEPGFVEVVDLMGTLVRSGRLTLVPAAKDARPAADGSPNIATIRLGIGSPGSGNGSVDRLRELLQVPAEQSEYVVYGGYGHTADGSIKLQSRSLIEILNAVAGGIQIPERHVEQGYAAAPRPGDPPLRIAASLTPPLGAFSTTRYADRYFYIADDDLTSKRGLSMLMLLLEFAQRPPEK